MSSTKHPVDATNTIDSNPAADATREESSLTLLERVKQLKNRQQLSHPSSRNAYGGPKVRADPRGTRRSMGKR